MINYRSKLKAKYKSEKCALCGRLVVCARVATWRGEEDTLLSKCVFAWQSTWLRQFGIERKAFLKELGIKWRLGHG